MTSWMADTVSRRDEAASQPAPARSRLEEVYLEHAAAFGRLAFLLTGNAQVAEDIVQEAFVRAFARLMHLRRHDTLESYLRRTVVNLTRKHWRRSKRERAYLAREARSGPRLTHQPDVALQEELWVSLQRLPYRQRAALVLRFYADLSERQTARLLGCTAGTVKSLVHRGLITLRGEVPWSAD
jgi:RNA polymerase sigma-70 factor (sigma-E family)